MSDTLSECRFFVPLTRDSLLSDGREHDTDAWEWLIVAMISQFDGFTECPELYRGAYRDPDTGERVNDESKQFVVAVHPSKLDEVRALLRTVCTTFQQKCIYLSIAGQVEFLGPTQ